MPRLAALALALSTAAGCATTPPPRDPVLYAAGQTTTWLGVAGIAGGLGGITYTAIEGTDATGAAVGLGFGVAALIVGTVMVELAKQP